MHAYDTQMICSVSESIIIRPTEIWGLDVVSLVFVHSSVKTFLPCFGRLKYSAIVQLWGGQQNILRVILET